MSCSSCSSGRETSCPNTLINTRARWLVGRALDRLMSLPSTRYFRLLGNHVRGRRWLISDNSLTPDEEGYRMLISRGKCFERGERALCCDDDDEYLTIEVLVVFGFNQTVRLRINLMQLFVVVSKSVWYRHNSLRLANSMKLHKRSLVPVGLRSNFFG